MPCSTAYHLSSVARIYAGLPSPREPPAVLVGKVPQLLMLGWEMAAVLHMR